MNPKTKELQARTHNFFVRVVQLCGGLSPSAATISISQQLVDSAGSANSNYRAACRARSRKEFIAKIGVAVEEADESLGWLEALRDASLGQREDVLSLIKEADELTAIFVASRKTAEQNEQQSQARKSAERLAQRRSNRSSAG